MLFEQFRMEWDGKYLHFLRSKLGQKDEIGHQTETQYQSPVISTSTSDVLQNEQMKGSNDE